MDQINRITLPRISVVIPAYKVSAQIIKVIESIGPEVRDILVVDDACPEGSGHKVLREINDIRVEVIFLETNQGVGGSVITGYKRALELQSDIVIKLDGDGQMDASLIAILVGPILAGVSGYSKGNRFFDVEAIKKMPKIRILGNLVLSFLTKLSTGYWKMFDPNNGFTAIDSKVLRELPLAKIDKRYFFESDMLFRLGIARVRVSDIAMHAIYGEEVSNLKVSKSLLEFSYKHFRNFYKRIIYSYYLRDFTLASIELPLGILLMTMGFLIGFYSWIHGLINNHASQPGTIVFVAMAVIIGLQFLLSFLSFDIANAP